MRVKIGFNVEYVKENIIHTGLTGVYNLARNFAKLVCHNKYHLEL